jgi:hypothetical protein
MESVNLVAYKLHYLVLMMMVVIAQLTQNVILSSVILTIPLLKLNTALLHALNSTLLSTSLMDVIALIIPNVSQRLVVLMCVSLIVQQWDPVNSLKDAYVQETVNVFQRFATEQLTLVNLIVMPLKFLVHIMMDVCVLWLLIVPLKTVTLFH